MIDIRIKKLHEAAVIPKYANPGDAGADLYSIEESIIPAHGRCLVKTGIAIAIPKYMDLEVQIRSRSGLALKEGIFVLNSPGTIDEGYRGEIGVILYNTTNVDFLVTKHMRIAQMVLNPINKALFEVTEELDKTIRGEGGFGSSGKF